MSMSLHETPLTRAYWQSLGQGILYEELAVADAVPGKQSRRLVDAVVVLGHESRVAGPRRGVSLDGEDVVVIQTKATRLNPYVFGQALLSAELIRLRWTPASVRSVVICVEDDPELKPLVESYANVEVRLMPSSRKSSFHIPRIRGAADRVHESTSGTLTAPARLTSRLRIDGLVCTDGDLVRSGDAVGDVTGRDLVSIHSYRHSLGMWVGGEVILTQALLKGRGARSVRSVVVCGRGDPAIERVLLRHATFDLQFA
jgi:hypothetical protein